MEQHNYGNYIPNVETTGVNCHLLAEDDKGEVERAKKYQELHPHQKVKDQDYISLASNCGNFIKSRKYTMLPVSKEEAEFSIGFALTIFKDIEQVERLLRAIYRPQNYYCIHLGRWKKFYIFFNDEI